MAFKSLCEKYFGSSNFYEILKIEAGANTNEIKKAYHRLSLLVHPDRVDESEKDIATEKFKALGKIHTILQDKEKRKIYDDHGDFDEDSDSAFNWSEYWKVIFKKIETKDIEEFERNYIGSDRELRDIKKAYEQSRGNMDRILELVPFSNCDSEPRIIEIVQKMVDDGEVEYFVTFFKESKQRKLRRRRKYEKERREVEKINFEDLERELENNMKKRQEDFLNFVSDLESRAKKPKRKSITKPKDSPKSKRTKK
ncbi:unnamed protein product [Phyllotreta striolata]|uniref:J domain-containing protein n=1 Tax=Phyllotreta striolata TaxID=444603 RepID=A0A9N9U1U2_PHYSR|nr:unnamed protein product [Phyllotreta striolata]